MVKQLNPLDMTGILSTDVSVLRGGLLGVKGILVPIKKFPKNFSKEQILEEVEKALAEIQRVLLEEEVVGALEGANE